ncbi:methylamine utilization protein MauJ [Desulfuromonas acetexigens]|uniref:ApeA N-terminal domain-containing protein n=1 Tax=Trichloromonas acetexigens TaxID=38815 RepID=A0A550JES5_9BACT|nr:methylamine utilization protein MauJ [Desulfuromonas acetexigens]TRO81727.1 hypothetical protein FL622_07930 [Desulfuromonas acetexigens]
MKTKWHFHFQTNDFVFEKEHKFIGSANGLNVNIAENLPENLELEISISPDKEKNNPNAEQTGTLYITLPLTHDEAKPVIHHLAFMISQKIAFDHGDFKLLGGLLVCERLPETPEEIEEVGDTPFSVVVNLVEAVPPPKFDSQKFAKKSEDSIDFRLVTQHNEARNTKNAIAKFIAFFKILESQFPPTHKKQHIKDTLKTNSDLLNVFTSIFEFTTEEEALQGFISFIDSIVHARHRCAHLKVNKNFGYLPFDPKIKEEVEPFLGPLEALTYETITKLSKSV